MSASWIFVNFTQEYLKSHDAPLSFIHISSFLGLFTTFLFLTLLINYSSTCFNSFISGNVPIILELSKTVLYTGTHIHTHTQVRGSEWSFFNRKREWDGRAFVTQLPLLIPWKKLPQWKFFWIFTNGQGHVFCKQIWLPKKPSHFYASWFTSYLDSLFLSYLFYVYKCFICIYVSIPFHLVSPIQKRVLDALGVLLLTWELKQDPLKEKQMLKHRSVFPVPEYPSLLLQGIIV